MKNIEVSLPKAVYVVCDPCYVMRDDLYMQMVDEIYIDHTNMKSHWAHDLGQVAVFNTAYGDGYYPSNSGVNFPVDAGFIGAVDVCLCDADAIKRYVDRGEAYMIDGTVSSSSTQDGKILTFNTLTINTCGLDNEDDEDEDDWFTI